MFKIAVFLVFFMVLILVHVMDATQVTINLNDKDSKAKLKSGSNQKTLSLKNSLTGAKIVAKGNRLSSRIDSDNLKTVEFNHEKKDYFRKAVPMKLTNVDHSQ